MRIFNNVRKAQPEGGESEGERPQALLEIQHPSFVDPYETYFFRDVIFAIVEYVGFSIADLLQRSICPSECEIVYIISQVSGILLFLNPLNCYYRFDKLEFSVTILQCYITYVYSADGPI